MEERIPFQRQIQENLGVFPCCFDTLTVAVIMCFDMLLLFIHPIFVLGLANRNSTG